jgi:N-acetylmuramoyl-L-alanine amidase
VTWHAGRSEYYAENIDRTYSNINKYGIGIELANYGKVERVGDEFKTAYGQNIAPENVYQHEDGTCWEQYTEAQIQETFDIALALARRYSCVDIVGHEEISPGRKIDPGPAFPLQELKDTLYAQSWYKWEQDNE